MNNGCWNGYHIKNALTIIWDGRPKILCAWFLTDERKIWNYRWNRWEERRTEAHISICSKVPPQVARLWTPGARGDDPWSQGVSGSEGVSGSGGVRQSQESRGPEASGGPMWL